MKHLTVLLGLMLSARAASVSAQSCTATNIPIPSGRIIYVDDTHGQIYLYDFLSADSCTRPVAIPAWNLTAPTNPVFSPDGQGIAFSAVQTIDGFEQRHLFYWSIGAELPINLTRALGNQRFEDVKFSPDGSEVVWKQSGAQGGIWTASFGFDAAGQPTISNPLRRVPGALGDQSEASGPVYSSDGNHLFYFTGSVCAKPQQIRRFDFAGGGTSTAFDQQSAANYYYYPAVDLALGKFLYVSGPIHTCNAGGGGPDKIFYYPNADHIDSSQPAIAWNAADGGADNSDPASIDGDYFIFSRNLVGGNNYKLYMGRLSTGDMWDLSPLNINNANGSMLGSAYTPSRPTITPFSLGGPKYSPGYGRRDRP